MNHVLFLSSFVSIFYLFLQQETVSGSSWCVPPSFLFNYCYGSVLAWPGLDCVTLSLSRSVLFNRNVQWAMFSWLLVASQLNGANHKHCQSDVIIAHTQFCDRHDGQLNFSD